MPIFVDGVDIGELFIDGVQQDTAFVDGEEVFTGVEGEEMFDDFNRSANGTPIENHTMNTGQGWQRQTGFEQPVAIQPLRGTQTAHATNPSSIVASSIQPVPLEGPIFGVAEAYVFDALGLWGNEIPPGSTVNIELLAGASIMRVNYSEFIDAETAVGEVAVSDQTVFLQQIRTVGHHGSGRVRMFVDLVLSEIQGQVITDQGTFNTNRFALAFTPIELSLRMTEVSFQGGQTNIGIGEFTATPYTSAGLPWPT